MTRRRPWDIFCQVVDNFGDIGVCWRLARQLASEHGMPIRLWVDDQATFARLAAGLDVTRAVQQLGAIEVRRWDGHFDAACCADSAAVIEAFGCGLPDTLLQAMAARPVAPVWINLEYLSAETWVEGCHGLSSPQPGWPLVRFFFFPGFTPATGGLLREAGLLARRDAMQSDRSALAAFWATLGLAAPQPQEQRISMFAYPFAPLTPLLQAWADGPVPVTLLLPEGLLGAQTAPFAGGLGQLRLQRFPFLPQDDYDRLLWACDFNFVRGEDSFVRAIWAARPFAWHIYPQEEGAHFAKLDAFLARCTDRVGPVSGAALRAFMHAWNGLPGSASPAAAWAALTADLPALQRLAGLLPAQIATQDDLVTQLLGFVQQAGGAAHP